MLVLYRYEKVVWGYYRFIIQGENGMEITLNLNNIGNSLELIKYCTLYFDRISIDEPILVDSIQECNEKFDKRGKGGSKIAFTPYISDEISLIKKILLKEGICIDGEEYCFGRYAQLAKKLVAQNSKLFFSPESFALHKNKLEIRTDAKIISDEAKQAVAAIVSEEDRYRILSENPKFGGVSDIPDFYFVFCLYGGLIDLLFSHIEEGKNVTTNSSLISKILLDYYTSNNKRLKKAGLKYNFAQIEATKILLPFVQGAPIDDILEIRYKANDELLQLRNYVETTLYDLKYELLEKIPPNEIKKRVNQKIVPSIREFERKLVGINIFTAKEFVKNMANPLLYSPMLTTFFSDVPPAVSLGFSLGMISLETFLQWKYKKIEIENEPLYFTVKIRNKI